MKCSESQMRYYTEKYYREKVWFIESHFLSFRQEKWWDESAVSGNSHLRRHCILAQLLLNTVWVILRGFSHFFNFLISVFFCFNDALSVFQFWTVNDILSKFKMIYSCTEIICLWWYSFLTMNPFKIQNDIQLYQNHLSLMIFFFYKFFLNSKWYTAVVKIQSSGTEWRGSEYNWWYFWN